MPTQGNYDGGGRVSVFDPAINPTFASGLWPTCPLWEHNHDPSVGVLLDENFVSYDAASTTGDYLLTQATTGTAAISTTVPGALLIDAGSTTAEQGANIQRLKSAFVPAANKSLWYETTILLTATTPPVTKAAIFVGLAASDTTIFASGLQTTNNRIGWQIETTGNLTTTFTSDKAGVATTKTGPTLTAATAVKLGFYYDGRADTVQQFVDGVASGTPVATTHIPKVVVYPSWVVQSDGTDRPNLIVRGVRVFQLR